MDLIHATIIIVTGRPAAGKSTLAKWLSQELKLPLVSKDSIREELFNRLGWKDRKWAQELGKASVDMMFYFARATLRAFKLCVIQIVKRFSKDLKHVLIQEVVIQVMVIKTSLKNFMRTWLIILPRFLKSVAP